MGNQLLNPRQEEFARLYYAGPEHLRGNGRRCYMEAYGQDDPECADAAASRLLRRDKVRARMREFRELAAEAAKARARSWWELYPEAQETLRKAAGGELEFEHPEQLRTAVRAAQEIVSRCEGAVKQVHEHSVQRRTIVALVAGKKHPVQREQAPTAFPSVHDADRMFIAQSEEELGEEEDSQDVDLQVKIVGRPPARPEE